jgi:hypothetical protein
MTQPPVLDGPPRWDESKQKWLSAYLSLRGSHDFRDLVCLDLLTNPHALSWWARDGNSLINASVSYRGQLVVVAVPKGSQWSLT